jgi:subfamily B ATP-binding cassette protein MsbA
MDDEKTKDTISFSKKIHAIWRHLRTYKRELILISFLGIFSALANGSVPLLVGKFLDALLQPKIFVHVNAHAVPSYVFFLFIWVVIQLIANGTDWVISLRKAQMGTDIYARITVDGYSQLLTLPISFFKDRKAGELTQLISRASWMIEVTVTSVLVGLAPQFLSIIVGLGIAFYLNVPLALVLVIGVVLYGLSLMTVLRPSSALQLKVNKLWNEAYGNFDGAYSNLQTVKSTGAELYERERGTAELFGPDGPATLGKKLTKRWNNTNAFQRFLVLLTQLTIFILSIREVLAGTLTIGELIAFNSYAALVFGPFVILAGDWQTLQNGLTSAALLDDVLEAEPEQYEMNNAPSLHELKGRVAFENVHFGYGEGKAEVLKGLSFVAEPKQVVALVGETGAGKSTTAELISGYYFASGGQITIDGNDIRTLSLRELRSHIAIVPQEVVLFNSTIIDNIRYGRPEASDAEVIRAAEQARADLFIKAFPHGYQQLVGERGIKLSVGQKQRIAIARAIVRNPRILILDEPTSALDAETEMYITKSLKELMHGRTTFIIAHRLSTVRDADKILVLKNGGVSEEGTHEILLNIEGGEYRRLYNLHVGLKE